MAKTRMIYTASTPSLAILEFLAHVDPEDAPEHLILLELALPGRLAPIPADLPQDWKTLPAPGSTQAYGTAWIEQKTSLTLSVPSILLPVSIEYIVLVNPTHANARKIERIAETPFSFDQRFREAARTGAITLRSHC